MADPTPQQLAKALTLNERMSEFGFDPSLKRGTLLPFGTNQQGENEWAVPEIGYGMMKAFVLPGHVAQGGTVTNNDVTDMALNTLGYGGFGSMGLGAKAVGGQGGKVLGANVVSDAERVALPTDTASRMARAKEMGYNTDENLFHGSMTKPEDIGAFDNSRIGSANDTGYYGAGTYFANTPGEAKYYGPHVGEYMTNAKLLDLSNNTGDLTFPGHFKSFAPKLKEIGALSDDQLRAYDAMMAAEKHFADNAVALPAISRDTNAAGWIAKIKNPEDGYEIWGLADRNGQFPTDKNKALESLRYRFLDEMERGKMFPGLGDEAASLSDYVRTSLGSNDLTKAAQKAGYGGIRYGDETVVFDPKNIRSPHAQFDPAKADSADLLAMTGNPAMLAAGQNQDRPGPPKMALELAKRLSDQEFYAKGGI